MWVRCRLSKREGKNFCFQTGEVKILVLSIDKGERRFVLAVQWKEFSLPYAEVTKF